MFEYLIKPDDKILGELAVIDRQFDRAAQTISASRQEQRAALTRAVAANNASYRKFLSERSLRSTPAEKRETMEEAEASVVVPLDALLRSETNAAETAERAAESANHTATII